MRERERDKELLVREKLEEPISRNGKLDFRFLSGDEKIRKKKKVSESYESK